MGFKERKKGKTVVKKDGEPVKPKPLTRAGGNSTGRTVFMAVAGLLLAAGWKYHLDQKENVVDIVLPLPQDHREYPTYLEGEEEWETLWNEPLKRVTEPSYHLPFDSVLPDGYRAYNPTVVQWGDTYVFGARVSNWSLCDYRGGRPYNDYDQYDSYVALWHVDAQFREIQTPFMWMIEDKLRQRLRTAFYEIFRVGVEDVRLVEHNGTLLGLGTYGLRGEGPRPTKLTGEMVSMFRMAALKLPTIKSQPPSHLLNSTRRLASSSFVPLKLGTESRDQQQKNWVPFVEGGGGSGSGRLLLEHSIQPHVVLSVDLKTGECTEIARTDNPILSKFGSNLPFRGGAGSIRLPEQYGDLYLGIAHTSRPPRLYTHFLYTFKAGPPYDIVGVSGEFCLGRKETKTGGGGVVKDGRCETVQFVSGMALRKEGGKWNLLVTYGVNDCDARVMALDLDTVMGWVRK